ncbi:deoxyribodipyrimidine photo-lyase [Fulvivirga sp. M361]|uniref:cryptochrome/photolyase family protein n=1 Tax=Fulvivirga sp. M361 TaxID=2594266 RepID=UPI00117AEF3A|nr:deoxyribodipyrimidine photo-lyase [Fulvivirga sp. M361]TRX57548.1 deoxyribodipyrimidine photo-lyase [Fulvivirga sp. M361]
MTKKPVNIFWFRRDLRLEDNTGLHKALEGKHPVLPIFIFDSQIIDSLEDRSDARLTFIHHHLSKINEVLKEKGAALLTFYGEPKTIWAKLLEDYNVQGIFLNRDYEPYARKRDTEIEEIAQEQNISFNTFKDHVLHEPDAVLKDDGTPYVVFTPYSRRWRDSLTPGHFKTVPSASYYDNYYQIPNAPILSLADMGFTKSKLVVPPSTVSDTILKRYGENRDYPAVNGTSRLGVHLRFGTISIRELAQQAEGKSSTFLNELNWREFYQVILWHFPRVVTENFKTNYNAVEWRNNEDEFQAWCEGKTGYPIVDAGMRELNATGYMHNRVRMIVASFLTKHLLIDWRWGEAYFAKKLLDYELASNNGGWQWAAGTGTDAQPYFRIFNPESQTRKFDPELKYIRQWVPEFQELNYAKPIVEHKAARERCLNTFKEALA